MYNIIILYGIVAGILRPLRQRWRTRKIISGSFNAYTLRYIPSSTPPPPLYNPNPFDRYAHIRKIFHGNVFLPSSSRPLHTVALPRARSPPRVSRRAHSRALIIPRPRRSCGDGNYRIYIYICACAYFGERMSSTLHTQRTLTGAFLAHAPSSSSSGIRDEWRERAGLVRGTSRRRQRQFGPVCGCFTCVRARQLNGR